MKPEIAAALDYWREVNASGREWARFEAMQFAHDLVVRVDVGRIGVAGHERAIATRSYYTDAAGAVRFTESAHA
jgi:hypothetical protein